MNGKKIAPSVGRIGRVALAGSLLLAVTVRGHIVAFASTNTWIPRQSNSDVPINSVAYGQDGNGHGLWVTGEQAGKIDTSPDGITWTFSSNPIDPNFTQYYASGVYGDKWVLVGQRGEIVTSTDGSHWSTQTSSTTNDLNSVTFGASTYVAVGGNGTILTSVDGSHWSSQTEGSSYFWGVTYGGGQFIAVGDGGTVYTSSDGTAWTKQSSGSPNGLYAVTYGNGQYVAVGQGGTILASIDGVSWTSRSSGSTNDFDGVAFGAGKYVAVGDDNLNFTIYSSLDGITWSAETPGTEPASGGFSSIAYGASKFVVGGSPSSSTAGYIQTQNYSNDADLSGLTLSSGTLSPAFSPGTTNYTMSVPYSTANLSITPTLSDSGATVTVNGNSDSSGSAVSVPLTQGSNSISIVVTSTSGVTKTYALAVTRQDPLSTNANLSDLSINPGTLTPSFSSATTSYSVSVPNSVSTVDVTPTTADSTATVTVSGHATTSGTAVSVPITVGDNNIPVVVTAQDGTTQKTYTITVTRPPSTNADLSNLTLSQGTLSPIFTTGTTTYTTNVDNNTTNLDLTATTADTTATLTVNGQPATSGAAVYVPLSDGVNTIPVIVTAQDGTTHKTYTITVTRAPSTNADLSNLTLSNGTLSPSFAAGTTTYTANVDYNTANLDLTATTADATSTLTVNGQTATSGTAVSVPLAVGSNTISVIVTAQDGTTVKTYTVTVTRPPSTNADLSNLTLSNGTLSPSFAAGTTTYTANVDYNTANLDLTATTADATSTLTVNGQPATSGTAVSVPLAVGSNTISVIVTAQDGTTHKTYTITVTRAPSTNADLSNLTLSQGTLSPSFAANTITYTANVDYNTANLDLTATMADTTSTLTVNGQTATSGTAVSVPLSVGVNTIPVVVTAQDGTTHKTYTITVTRTAPSTNANLSNLTLSQGTLSPSFAVNTDTYTANVDYNTATLDLTATTADTTSTVTVNGQPATSGSAVSVALSVGVNTIPVIVTAQDGTTHTTYTLTVTRASSSGGNNGGTNPPGGGTTNPEFPQLPIVLLTQSVGSGGSSFSKTIGDVTVQLDVPQGAFTEPTQITLTQGTSTDVDKVVEGLAPNRVAVVFGVSFSGSAATKPITVTITSPGIKAQGRVYKLTSSGELIPVPASVAAGTAVVSFGADPDFVLLNVEHNERVITLAGHTKVVLALVHRDAGVATTYMPIWYVMQLLKEVGIQSTWDVNTWRVTTKGGADMSHIRAGTGTAHIYLNGTLVQNVTPLVAKDPSTNHLTTYMPIWYVMQLLNRLQLKSSWDGTTWTISEDSQN